MGSGSTVKVKALDVVASQKIKVGLVVVPLYWTGLAIFTTWYSGLSWWWFFPSCIAWLLATVVGLRICDEFWKHLIHTRTNFSTHWTKALFKIRTELQTKTRDLVEEFAPQIVEDWSHTRVVSKRDLAVDS